MNLLTALSSSLPLWATSLLRVLLPLAAAIAVDLAFQRGVRPMATRRLQTLDNKVLVPTRAALFATVFEVGLQPSLATLLGHPDWAVMAQRLLASPVILLWTVALVRLTESLVHESALRGKDGGFVNKHTQPLIETSAKLLLGTLGAYILLDAWGQDLSVLLASATVSGIALGFAAQETLGNLFAGFFLFTDPPFKLGDYLVLADGTRGRVLDIRLRTTRLLTNDGVEITIPNREVANVRITNETGGPSERARVRVLVQVAFGTNLHTARSTLLDAARSVTFFQHPEPEHDVLVRWRAFKDSGIEAEVVGWIDNPSQRENATHDCVVAIYEGLAAADIRIPYTTHSVHLVGGAHQDDPVA